MAKYTAKPSRRRGFLDVLGAEAQNRPYQVQAGALCNLPKSHKSGLSSVIDSRFRDQHVAFDRRPRLPNREPAAHPKERDELGDVFQIETEGVFGRVLLEIRSRGAVGNQLIETFRQSDGLWSTHPKSFIVMPLLTGSAFLGCKFAA